MRLRNQSLAPRQSSQQLASSPWDRRYRFDQSSPPGVSDGPLLALAVQPLHYPSLRRLLPELLRRGVGLSAGLSDLLSVWLVEFPA